MQPKIAFDIGINQLEDYILQNNLIFPSMSTLKTNTK